MLTKYAAHLLATGQQLHAVELYRKAKQHAEAAKLLNKLAKASPTLSLSLSLSLTLTLILTLTLTNPNANPNHA